MSRRWYILQTYTGYENKTERSIKTLLESGTLDSDIVTDVRVPVEEVVEIKDGKKKSRTNKFLPGYVMLEMDLPEFGWKPTCTQLRRLQGVNGFVGTNPNVRPIPISNDEAMNLLQKSGVIKGDKQVHLKQSYSIGDNVKITEGPFATFTGSVKEIFVDREKMTVEVQIFGRPTPVEVSFSQAEKQ